MIRGIRGIRGFLSSIFDFKPPGAAVGADPEAEARQPRPALPAFLPAAARRSAEPIPKTALGFEPGAGRRPQ